MKTIVCEEIGSFVQREDERTVPGPGEVLLRISRIGICGTDLHAFRGNQPFFTYPRILGHELSGVIEELPAGTESGGLKVGDLVTVMPYLECGTCAACRKGKTNCCVNMRVLGVHTDGGMREYLAVPADHLISAEGMTPEQAAIVEPLSIGAHAIRRSGLSEGDTALVIGGGPIGLGVMALAKLAGAKVIAMDVNEERLAFCKSFAGVDETVNALQEPAARLAELTGGDLPSIVFDATGNARSMEASFGYAAHGGTLVFVGLVKADLSFHDPDFHKKELTLLGSRNATREDFETVLQALRSGRLKTDGYITHRTGFDQMIGEFEGWLDPASGVIKAVVEV